jgi:sec-independent protein translocase protein TatA
MAWRPGLPELIIVLVLIILLFGPNRITKIAREIGQGIKNFREGLGDDKSVNSGEELEDKS